MNWPHSFPEQCEWCVGRWQLAVLSVLLSLTGDIKAMHFPHIPGHKQGLTPRNWYTFSMFAGKRVRIIWLIQFATNFILRISKYKFFILYSYESCYVWPEWNFFWTKHQELVLSRKIVSRIDLLSLLLDTYWLVRMTEYYIRAHYIHNHCCVLGWWQTQVLFHRRHIIIGEIRPNQHNSNKWMPTNLLEKLFGILRILFRFLLQ